MHGMASPGAVAWVYECVSSNPALMSSLSPSIPLYHKLSSSIWASRNTALYAYCAEAAAPRSEPLFIDVDASSVAPSSRALDDASIALAPVSPSISHITCTNAGSKSKKPAPYPPSKPPALKRATDDDVRAAQTLICPPAPSLPEEVIELTSDSGVSETEDLATRTVMKAPSPVLATASPVSSLATERPSLPPIIMSPSPIPPRKTRSAKVASKLLPASKKKKSRKSVKSHANVDL